MSISVPNIRITKKQQPIIIVAVLVIVIVVLALFAVPVNVWAGDWSHPIRICDLRVKVQGTYRCAWLVVTEKSWIENQEIIFYQENWRSRTIMSIFGVNNNPPFHSLFATQFAIYVTLERIGTQQMVIQVPLNTYTMVFDKDITFSAVNEGIYTVTIKPDIPFGKLPVGEFFYQWTEQLTYKVSVSEDFPTAEQVG